MKNAEKYFKENIVFPADDFKIKIDKCTGGATESAFHEALEIKYYHKGGATIMVNSKMHFAEEGDVTIVNPYEIHSHVDVKENCEVEYKLFLDVGFLTEFTRGEIDLRKELISKGKRIKTLIKNDRRVVEIILSLYRELTEKRENYRLLVYSLITELFVILLRDYSVEKSAVFANKNLKRTGVISPALNKIFKDYSKKITIDELANLCSVSKYHFCHAFKSEMGVSAVQYLIKYRVSVARTMLENSNDSIESIAYRCGFEDLSYFYRCYKKVRGVSPKKRSEVKGVKN